VYKLTVFGHSLDGTTNVSQDAPKSCTQARHAA